MVGSADARILRISARDHAHTFVTTTNIAGVRPGPDRFNGFSGRGRLGDVRFAPKSAKAGTKHLILSGDERRPPLRTPESIAAYGVRSAVTSRASRTVVVLEPELRRQEAPKFGQFCCEQSWPIGRMSRRSALASGRGTLASTCGAKPGRMARAAARHAAIATAERVLIMTVPCHRALVARVVWRLDTNRAFPEFFAEVGQRPKMVSSGGRFVSSPSLG